MITAYIDGGARGNPGPAGYGVYIEGPDGAPLQELYGGLGIATNNVAEYNGLLRELNKDADRLSNLGMDAAEEALESGS